MDIIKVPQSHMSDLKTEVSSKVGGAYVVPVCTSGIHLLNVSWCKSAQTNQVEVSNAGFNICSRDSTPFALQD